MKKKWTLSLVAIVAAIIVTSCGQPKSNKKEVTASEIEQQSLTGQPVQLDNGNVITMSRNTSLNGFDQNRLIHDYQVQGQRFVGNEVDDQGRTGIAVEFEFLNHSCQNDNEACRIYAELYDPATRYRYWTEVTSSGFTGTVNFGSYTISLNADPNCMNIIGLSYGMVIQKAFVCKQ